MSFGSILGSPPAPDQGRRVALVIGNASYRHAPPLCNPANDACDIANALSGLGFEIVGGERDGVDLVYGDMAARLRDFGRRLREGANVETALMFFAGHGIQVDGRNYLVPTDAALEYEADVGSELFELQHILNLMERPKRTSLVLVDACRNNPLARNLARLSGMRQASVGPGLAEQKVVAGTLLAFATQPGHAAYDGEGRNSFFTEALLAHVSAPDREIELMLKDVRAKVVSATAQKEQGPQVPWVHSSLVGSYYLNPAKASSRPPPSGSQSAQLDATTGLMQLAAREWAQLQTSTDVVRLKHFAQHFPGYYGDLAFNRVADLEREASEHAPKAAQPAKVPFDKQEPETPARVADRPVSAFKRLFAAWGRKERVQAPEQSTRSLEELERAAAEQRSKEQQWRDEGRIEVRTGNGQIDKSIWLKAGQAAPLDLNIAPEMVLVPPGRFWMGSKDGEGEDSERPRHEVTITHPLLVGKYPITFGEWNLAQAHRDWKRHTGIRRGPTKACGAGGVRRAVGGISWKQARAYTTWLSKATGKTYRLLSEAEWEYCCRARTTTAYYFGDEISMQQAHFAQGREGGTVIVGKFPPNAFGLHDMHGNVREWCADHWHRNYAGAPADGSVWDQTHNEILHVVRGGSWGSASPQLRSASRDRNAEMIDFDDLGFRVARDLLPAS